MNQNWPCHKIDQGHPRVIFCINFVELKSLLLHTNFQDNCSSGSEGADFFTVLSIAAILVMWLWPFEYHYFSHPILALLEMYFHLDLSFLLRKHCKKSTQVTLAKVNKWSWPLAFKWDEVHFLTLSYNNIIRLKIFSFSHPNARGIKIDLVLK